MKKDNVSALTHFSPALYKSGQKCRAHAVGIGAVALKSTINPKENQQSSCVRKGGGLEKWQHSIYPQEPKAGIYMDTKSIL